MTELTMPAAVYRGPDDVRLEAIPVPRPGPQEILVRVRACGVCGTDLKKVRYGLQVPPRVFGHEIAGVVKEVGAGVETWSPGDRVVVYHHVPCELCHFCRAGAFAQCHQYKRTGTTAGFEPAGGGFARYVRVMDWVVERGVQRIPGHVSDDEAAFVEPVNTCLKGVQRSGARAGDVALVVGQGQIGLLFTQLLRLAGVFVVAADPLPERQAVAKALGANEVVGAEPGAQADAARRHTDGRGADVAVLTVAGAGPLREALEGVRPGGRVVLFAHTLLGDPVEVDAGEICVREKDLIGSYSSDVTLNDEAARLVFERAINVRDLVTHRFPLDEIARALDIAAAPRSGSLKVMIFP